MGVIVNPVVTLLYDANGVALAVQNGVAIPASTPAIIVAGSDGTNARYVRTATDGTVRVDPTGTTTQPVSGTVTANAGTGTFSDQHTDVEADYDSGAGTQNVTMFGVALPANGGAVAGGSASNPFRVDPTGTTTQPVSAAALPLPAGAATSAIQTNGTQKTQVVDGSGNVQNAGDVAARALFAKVTDGTNLLPTMDVAARAGFFKLTDGTNVMPTADVAARAIYSFVTDGTHTMPTLDAATRAGFVKLTDGTNVQTIKAASTAAVAADQSAVVALSPNTPLPAGTNTLGKADQGAPNTLANRWPVQHTDGTNVLPTADVASRALFAKVTDGTNTQPTGDAAARKIFVQPTDGTNTAGYDANNHGFVAGKSATGVAPTSNPVSVSGVDDAGLKRALLTWTEGSLRTLPNSHRTVIHNNATITATGSIILSGLGMSEWYLIINLKNAPTGTTPTITFKVEAVDPVDQSTVIDATTTEIGVTHTAAGVEAIQFADNITDTVKITWTITGTTPSWTGVNVSWVGHVSGNAIEGQAEAGAQLREGPLPVAGVDGSNNVQVLKVDTSGSLQVVVSNLPAGTVPGVRPGLAVLAGGTSGTLNPIRGTAYTEPSSNAQRSVSSSSASDASAGTGARTITITYYDSTGAGPFAETVTLNGVTAVNTVSTTICYIESIVVASVGSGGSNAGTITLFGSTGGAGGTIGTIGIGNVFTGVGDNRTLWAHHYVPTGKTCNVTGFVFGATASSTFHLKSKSLAANTPETVLTEVMQTAAEFQRAYSSPPKVTGPARIVAYGVPSTNGVTLNASFDFYDQ